MGKLNNILSISFLLRFFISFMVSNSFKIAYRVSNRVLRMSSSVTSPVRVRFAPSPTGSLHVGGARTALFNWLLAKKTGGKFIIRVEDTDEARSTKASEQSILADLNWMQLRWDEGPVLDENLKLIEDKQNGPYGPYRQSERKDIYLKCANDLIEKGFAYRCFCSEEELEEKRQKAEAAGEQVQYDGTWRDADPAQVKERMDRGDPYTIRFKVPPGSVVSIQDLVRGKVTWDADASLGDFIILRSNGMPVYNFCVAVDDCLMKITHVIRAEEHLTNTLRQMLVLQALGYTPPTYAHVSLILGSDRSKLSKRHGATSLQQFSEQGFLPQAMMNYLAKLGWNDGTDKEIYNDKELIQAFDLSRIIPSPAVFDMDKLRWINAQHIKLLPKEELSALIINALSTPDSKSETPAAMISKTDGQYFNALIELLIKMTKDKLEVIIDVRKVISDIIEYNLAENIENDPHSKEVLGDGFNKISSIIVRDYESGAFPKSSAGDFQELWKAYVKNVGKELGIKGKDLFHPLRFALTGRMSGPDIGDQLQFLSMAQESLSDETNKSTVNLDQRVKKLKEFIGK